MTATETAERLSGWCVAAPGARPPCGDCKVPGCQHGCHREARDA